MEIRPTLGPGGLPPGGLTGAGGRGGLFDCCGFGTGGGLSGGTKPSTSIADGSVGGGGGLYPFGPRGGGRF